MRFVIPIIFFVFVSGCMTTSNRTHQPPPDNMNDTAGNERLFQEFFGEQPRRDFPPRDRDRRQFPQRRQPLRRPPQEQPPDQEVVQEKKAENPFSSSHFIGSVEFSKYKRLAVLPFTDAPDVDKSGTIVQGVAIQKFSQFGFDVVERSRLDDIINEQNFSKTSYADKSSSVELGKLLGVQAIVLGEVSLFSSTRQVVSGVARMESFVSLTMRVVDVETGAVVFSGSGSNKRGLYSSPDEITNALLNKLLYLWLTSPGLIGLQYDREKIILKVASNSSAEEAGIMPGDKIISINGYDLAEIERLKEREIIYGKPSTSMDITIERNGEKASFTLIRQAKEDLFK